MRRDAENSRRSGVKVGEAGEAGAEGKERRAGNGETERQYKQREWFRRLTGDMSLLHLMLREPLGKSAGHCLRRERDREGEVGDVVSTTWSLCPAATLVY
jgi:hypothetical protein